MSATMPSRSPWVEQLAPLGEPSPIDRDLTTDVVVVGAGIAGAATAFFLLQHTEATVILVERGRIGSGATGHNAGQLATYFERPLASLVEEFGFERALNSQRALDRAWDQVEVMLDALGDDLGIERFTGYLGMYTLDHVVTHLRHSALRRQAGLDVPELLVADDAPFLSDIPSEFDGLYGLAEHDQLLAVLGTSDRRYCGVLLEPCGVGNGALLVQRIVQHLKVTHPRRFRFADHTKIEHITLHEHRAECRTANGHVVQSSRVVLCTNGYLDHDVQNLAGQPIDVAGHHQLIGTVGLMAGFLEPGPSAPLANSFIRNLEIGLDTPYVYVTRRKWEGDTHSLVCFGGPEYELESAEYDVDAGFPLEVAEEIDRTVVPLAYPARVPGMPYDFAWHGLMGYTGNRVRLIGAEPRNPVLLYNLGCNGVGFMPSIMGGDRIARLLAGRPLEPTIFDPPA
jgi:glycine/D-amino acid oxidase-like deaminating enzyme